MNPQQTVPTLQDNEHVIWDSHVISTYLVNKYSKYDYLYPKDLTARSLVDQRLYFDGSILYPVIHNALVKRFTLNLQNFNQFYLQYPILFHRKMGISAADRSNVQTNYKILEAFLNKYFWLCGNYMTIADLCCAASISTMDFMVPISQQDYPKLYEFLERCKKLPYYEMCNQTGLDQLISILQEKILISKASSTRI